MTAAVVVRRRMVAQGKAGRRCNAPGHGRTNGGFDMAEVTPRSCIGCNAAVTRRQGKALCPECVTERNRARARDNYYAARARAGAPRRGDTVSTECTYCSTKFEHILAGRVRYVCDTCEKTRSGQARARWRQNNPDKSAAISARYFANHPDAAAGRAAVFRFKKYGVTAEWEARTLAAQGGKCGNPGCGATSPGGRWDGNWHIDHCHRTGVVRGLLCDRCNKGVGMFDDDPAKLAGMIEYLTRERASE